MNRTALLLVLAVAVPPRAALGQAEGRVQVELRLPLPVVVVEESPPPPRPPPPAPPPARLAPPPHQEDVLRTKEIKAERVHARVIYAKEVKAKGGSVGRVIRDRRDKTWEHGRGDGEIKAPEVTAEVIYAKTIDAQWLEASEVHANEVKIGK